MAYDFVTTGSCSGIGSSGTASSVSFSSVRFSLCNSVLSVVQAFDLLARRAKTFTTENTELHRGNATEDHTLNQGVIHTYLMLKSSLTAIFIGRAIIVSMKNCMSEYCNKLI